MFLTIFTFFSIFHLVFFLFPVLSVKTLLRSIIIHRHGVRHPLHKTEFAKEDPADVKIFGQVQLSRLGKIIGYRYRGINESNEERFRNEFDNLPFISETYNMPDGMPTEVYAQSTSVDRAIRSGMAFLKGLYADKENLYNEKINDEGVRSTRNISYPYNNVILRTVPEPEDIYLRGWVDCPEYKKNLELFYDSEEFIKKEAESQNIRKSLAEKLEKISNNNNASQRPKSGYNLKTWWNVFDSMIDKRIYGIYLKEEEQFTTEELNEAYELAAWVESKRYSYELLQYFGGGMMGRRICETFQFFLNITNNKLETKSLSFYENVYKNFDQGHRKKLQTYSAHYPSMMSIGAAIGVSFGNEIPNFASAIAIELFINKEGNAYEAECLPYETCVQIVYIQPYIGVDSLEEAKLPGKIVNLEFNEALIWNKSKCYKKTACEVNEFLSWLSRYLSNFSKHTWCQWCYKQRMNASSLLSKDNFCFFSLAEDKNTFTSNDTLNETNFLEIPIKGIGRYATTPYNSWITIIAFLVGVLVAFTACVMFYVIFFYKKNPLRCGYHFLNHRENQAQPFNENDVSTTCH